MENVEFPRHGSRCLVRNKTKNKTLAERALVARSFFSRLKGLLGTRGIAAGEGLLFEPCSGIHMFGMTYAIDAVFIDKTGAVVGVVGNFAPNAPPVSFNKARACVELPAGTLAASGTEDGDTIVFELVPGG